ncbi:MAG: hypothetical protein ACK6DV_08095, partial [Deltaproteobacteria bacterium]
DLVIEGAPFRTGVGKPTVPGKSPFVFPSRAQEAEIMRLQAAAFDPHPIEIEVQREEETDEHRATGSRPEVASERGTMLMCHLVPWGRRTR